MAPLPQPFPDNVTGSAIPCADRIQGTMSPNFVWRLSMSLSKILLIIALICFILDALAGRMKFRAPFSLLPGGLAFLTASYLF